MQLSLLNDLAFKYLFARDEHGQILRGLLNALLHYEGDERIAEVQIKNPFVASADVTSKKIVLDINAKDTHGRQFTIEMQVKQEPFYVERVVFYGAKLHADQLEYQFFELPELGPEGVSKSDTLARKWLYFIKQSERYSDPASETPEALLEEKEIAMALDAFRLITSTMTVKSVRTLNKPCYVMSEVY
jgi:predicted transposase/invertase (TIGR01784 family)